MRGDLIDPQRLELDRYLAAYEAAQLRDGAADLAEFLPAADHPLYGCVLRELVRIDMELAWEHGQPRRLEDYRRQFPELAEDRESLQAVAFEEYRLRHQAGEQPRADEYRLRYGLATDDWPLVDQQPSGSNGSFRSAAHGSRAVARPEPIFPNVGEHFLDFELCAELGRGSFARVFLARQGGLGNRYVALKIAPDIVSETQALVQLQHTHIVPIYSVHRAGPFQALCMPYFGGTTLADVLQKLRGRAALPDSGKDLVQTLVAHKSTTRQPVGQTKEEGGRMKAEEHGSSPDASLTLPAASLASTVLLETLGKLTYVEAVLWLSARLADGLEHAHERGILHRDLKPANVLLTEEGQPMLLDFNLSEDVKRRGASAAVMGGTLPYMAPEQLVAFQGGLLVDARGDVYALGVILHELLTGRPPFPARHGPLPEVLAAMLADRAGPPPAVRPLNPAVSPAVESMVRRCLEPDPARRYLSAGDLREDLQRHLDNQPLRHAPEPSRVERLRKWLRRHPRLASTTGVAACAALVVAILITLLVLGSWHLGRVEALEARRQLRDDLQAVQFYLSRPDAEARQRADGLARCRRAAERYELLDGSSSRTRLARALPAEDQVPLRGELGELLLAWTRGLTWQAAAAPDDERKQEWLQLGSRLLARAEACYDADAVPRVLWLERARVQELAGDTAEASRLRAIAETVPLRTPRDRYLLLLHQTERGIAPEMLAFLQEASRQDAQDYSVWLVLGNCHAALGQSTQAAGCFDIGIALRPDEPWAYFNRGLLHLDGKNFQQASADFDRVLQLRREMPEAYFNRALARLGLDRPAEALADLTRLLESTPRPATRVYFARARVRAQLGDQQGQRQDLDEGMRREPTDEHDCVTRGVARLDKDPQGALADFERALTFNPRSRRALQNQASVLAEKLDQPAKAVERLDRLLTLHPNAVLALAGRGVLHARLGQRAAAHQDAQATLARDRTPALLYQVACIYALTSRQQPDDRVEALRLLSAALRQGYGFDLLAKDKDLDPLRDGEEFQRLREAARALPKS